MNSPSLGSDVVVLAPLALRPMARASRIAIFEREVRERLSRAALEALFSCAEVLSEGQASGGKRAAKGSGYHGSTMLTIALGSVRHLFREAPDAGNARKLAAMLVRDAGARARIKAIAGREAERILQRKVNELQVEITASAKGATVMVDVDVEAAL